MIGLSDDHYALDISRSRALLGWEPRHSLRNTLPTMLNELKSDPAGWYQENDLRVQPIPDGPPWRHVVNMLLGLWLIGTTPALSMTVHALRHAWAAWTVCGIGLWVMSAPLLFWASNAAVYNTDLLTGALVVVFAVIVPQFGHDGPG